MKVTEVRELVPEGMPRPTSAHVAIRPPQSAEGNSPKAHAYMQGSQLALLNMKTSVS